MVVPEPQFTGDMVAVGELLHQGMSHGGVSMQVHHLQSCQPCYIQALAMVAPSSGPCVARRFHTV